MNILIYSCPVIVNPKVYYMSSVFTVPWAELYVCYTNEVQWGMLQRTNATTNSFYQ
jgi:hypothetical protein